MKKELIFRRTILIVSLILLVFGLLNANYGIWYGRGAYGNLALNEKVTVGEVQDIFAKEHWPSFLLFKSSNTEIDNQETVRRFWEYRGNTILTNSDEEANLQLVQKVFPNAQDTSRKTLYLESLTKKTEVFMYILMAYIFFMIFLPGRLKIILNIVFFNSLYLYTFNTVGAILPILELNAIILISCLIKENKNLRNIKIFRLIDKCCTNFSLNFITKFTSTEYKAFEIWSDRTFSYFKFWFVGILLMAISALMIACGNIGILFNIISIFIIFVLVSEINNQITYSKSYFEN